MTRPFLLAAGLASLCLAGLAPAGAEGQAGLAPEALIALFPPAWEGVEADAAGYEPAPGYSGEVGRAAIHYREAGTGAHLAEYSFRLNDMGSRAGRMYQDYGADYLKGPVENESQRSLEVKGQPALLTETSETTMEITTFFPPGLTLSIHCMNVDADQCRDTLARMDFEALTALAATTPAE